MSHFDEMTGLLYLEGQLDDGQASEIKEHAASCVECRKLLCALERENAWLREALAVEEEAIPASLLVAPTRPAAPWVWIAALAFGAMGIYTLWTGFVDPWLTQASQVGFTQGNLLTMLFFTGAFWKGWGSMLILVEFLAAATLGILGIWLLRKQWRRFSVTPVVMTALLCLLAVPSSMRAAELKHGDPNYTLSPNQEINTDLFVTGEHTQIDGNVDGDLIVWSRSVVVNGHVKGDVIAFGQDVRVDGPVDGNVRAFAQTLTLNGSVAKNVMAWAREVDMDSKARVAGTMTVGSSNAELDGQIEGDVLAFADVLNIDGSLGRDATIRAQRLIIGPSASIAGHIRYRGGRQPEVAAGAKLATPIQIITRVRPIPRYASPGYYWRQVLLWGASFLFGLVLLLVAPRFFRETENASKRFGPSMGFGLLFLFATPIAAIIACVTIVGLGVGLSVLFVYLIALYAAQVFVGTWLGEKLLGPGEGSGPVIGRLALGLAILRVLRALPFAGGVIGFIVVIWGLGALVLALYRRMRSPVSAAA
jgi:cytoskeletal protein CcmA (bactofilin family)